jgi:hypothetical protein
MPGKPRKSFLLLTTGVFSLALALSPSELFSQVPVPVDTGQPIPVLSPNELNGLVAPIALYPDPLVSQILVAATYPLEVVEAYQWLQRNPGLTGPALMQGTQAQNWDPSVQALVMFPDVLRRLNEDVAWTSSLGNAFLTQQADVMGAIQRMRVSAQQAGTLLSTPQQEVITTVQAGEPVVEIVPANPEVIYVPVYDPVWVWGPRVYYPYPHWHYPRPHSGIFFSVGIPVGNFVGGWGGWRGWGWHPAWHDRTVVVNNTFNNQYNFNSTRGVNVAGASVWSHDAGHRHGVPYPAPRVNEQVAGNSRPNPRAPSAAVPVQPPVHAFAPPRPSAPVAVPSAPARQTFREVPDEGLHNRPIAPNISNHNSSAFGFGRPTSPPIRSVMPTGRHEPAFSHDGNRGGEGGRAHRGEKHSGRF